MGQFKNIQQEVYYLIKEGRYIDDIMAYLQGKYRLSRDQAYSLYMNVNSSIPMELDEDGDFD